MTTILNNFDTMNKNSTLANSIESSNSNNSDEFSNDKKNIHLNENSVDENKKDIKSNVYLNDSDEYETTSDDEDEDINYFNYDDENEFEIIFKRVENKINNINKNESELSNENVKTTLKYLFKLLKFYKLEYYMNDLIDNGFLNPISLNKLKQNDLDQFNVSPYDKKKFIKLQSFLKQVVSTINKTKTSTKTQTLTTTTNINNKNNYSSKNKFQIDNLIFDPNEIELLNENKKMFEHIYEWQNLTNKFPFKSCLSRNNNNINSNKNLIINKPLTKNNISNSNDNKITTSNLIEKKTNFILDKQNQQKSKHQQQQQQQQLKVKISNSINSISTAIDQSNSKLNEKDINKNIDLDLLNTKSIDKIENFDKILLPISNTNSNSDHLKDNPSTLINEHQTKTPVWISESKLNESNKNENISKTRQNLFLKNPNSNKKMKRIVRSATSNSSNLASSSSIVKVNNKRVTSIHRAKSTEPHNLPKKSFSISSKSTNNLEHVNSVTHPQSNTNQLTKSNNNYFGPKLDINPENKKEISHVKLIEANTYNYGVPQHNQPTVKRNNNLIRKNFSSTNNNNNYSTSNQLQHSSLVTSDIYVYARKRPKLSTETQFEDVISVENVIIDSDNFNITSTNICVNDLKTAVDGTPILTKNEFTFDKTFDSSYTNDDIFKSSIGPFLNIPYDKRTDFSCICFGQTGSGKTHTLFGNKQQDGLCVLTAENLFTNNEKLYCGFYEIYNGQLYDLINKNNKLVLREDSNGQVNVVGLVEIEIKSLAQLRKTIETAQSNRHIGSTSFNKASSRSHAVIQFKIPNPPSTHYNSGNVIFSTKNQNFSNIKSKVNSGLNCNSNQTKPFRVLFIDLAGSERGIDAQNNLHDNRKEGAEINQSLLALKECIRCIDQFCAHAPFRQSKLTRVLRDCFIGAGRTVLIATVSPTDDCVSCSLNTLQYANRVRQMAIRNHKKNDVIGKRPLNSVFRTNSTNINQKSESNRINIINVPVNKLRQGLLKNSKDDYQSKRKSIAPSSIYSAVKSSIKENSQKERSKSIVGLKRQETVSSIAQSHTNEGKVSSKYITNSQSLHQVSSMTSAAIAAAVASVKATNVPTNSILPNKLYSINKITSNNSNQQTYAATVTPVTIKQTTLFHPSKINMSSTPIKSSLNNQNDLAQSDDIFFENDTPIKGHKIKHLIKNSSDVIELAERYFARVTVPDHTARISNFNDHANHKTKQKPIIIYEIENDLNSKVYCKATSTKTKNNNDNHNFDNHIRNYLFSNAEKDKNDDNESGVESDELNKSIEKRALNSNNIQNFTSKQSVKSKLNDVYNQKYKYIYSLESPPPEREIENKNKFELKQDNPINNSCHLNDESLNRLRKKQREMLETKKFLLTGSNCPFDSTADGQEGTEYLFTNHDENNNLNSSSKASIIISEKLNESEHLKNAINSQKQLRTYIENLENKLTNLRNEIGDQSTSKPRERTISNESSDSLKEIHTSINPASNTYEEFIKRRKHLEKQQNSLENMKIEKSSYDDCEKMFIENQIKDKKSCDILNKSRLSDVDSDSDHDAFEKSIHGSFLFSSNSKKTELKVESKICQFSPITQVDSLENNLNLKSEINKAEIDSNLTQHTQLLNPIPIRLSSSSSSFESSFSKSCKQMQNKNDDQQNLSKLNSSFGNSEAFNSKIWKVPSQNIESNSRNKWSSILMESQTNNNELKTKSEVENSNTNNPNKALLIVAHENQLSALTESCKKEMNLLLSLKDSQLDFSDYLKQVEEMLSKKVHSIRDLQNQISQLKTYSTFKSEISVDKN